MKTKTKTTAKKARSKAAQLVADTARVLQANPAADVTFGYVGEFKHMRRGQRRYILGKLANAIRITAEIEQMHPDPDYICLSLAIEQVARAALQRDDDDFEEPPNLDALGVHAGVIEEIAYWCNPCFGEDEEAEAEEAT